MTQQDKGATPRLLAKFEVSLFLAPALLRTQNTESIPWCNVYAQATLHNTESIPW